MSFTIEITERTLPGQGMTTTAKLAGRLDSVTAPQAEAALAKVRAKILVFDLSGLDFISSAGLRVILGARKGVVGQGGACVLAYPQPQIHKVLEVVKALPGLAVFQNDAEMDQYLAEIQRRVKSES